MSHPPTHTLIYGDSGAGKSSLAATYPKPMLVTMHDPMGKDMPYMKGAISVSDFAYYPISISGIGGMQIMYRDVTHADGVIRLEYYHDFSVEKPDAYMRYMHRMNQFAAEFGNWKTLVTDSLTFLELCARKWGQYVLDPTAKDPRKWYGKSTELLEEMLMIRYAGYPLNVVVIAHIDEDKDDVHGMIVRNPSMPGKLRKKLATAYSEVYRMFVMWDEQKKQMVHVMQTRLDNLGYMAQSQIGAPNPCYPHYESLWVNQ